MRNIYLARHGEIGLEKEKRYIGQTDLNLSQKGQEQAVALKTALSGRPIGKIYSSSLKRSIRTASIIGTGHALDPVIVPEFAEINMGAWEGLSFASVLSQYPGAFAKRGEDPAGFRPSGGESFGDLYRRVIPAFEDMVRNTPGDIVLVAHAGVNRVILSYILGLPLANIFRLRQNYGCLNVISYDNETYCLERLNLLP